ncbi:MAG: coproporphyrinogen III oxidase [Paracoccaceae bacterium]|nr:MAG: coproporphyrinogen III oxidase [Paracoccaceae bacterium]
MFHVKHSRAEADWQNGGFGLYLHWPFCESKCPYCDFNSHVAARIDQGQWREAYLAEIARAGAETSGRLLRSVFFGGGTPSLMEPALVSSVLRAVRETWPVANDLEVTLEANPGSVEAARFAAYRDAGVNRISIGVQALNDRNLAQLGRRHDSAGARSAIRLAQSVFPRVSFDLIYARQNQTAADWRTELSEALAFGTGHLSLYQLTIEPGTPFAARHAKGGLRGLPDEALSADMYELTQKICEAHGLPAYEVSNHARPGEEARHNMIYWQAGDYLGIGPGAHGRISLNGQRIGTECPRQPETWLRAALSGQETAAREPLSGRDQAIEYAMMGLRLEDGIDLSRMSRMAGCASLPDFSYVTELGLAEISHGRLRATRSGRLVLNGVIARVAEAIDAAT